MAGGKPRGAAGRESAAFDRMRLVVPDATDEEMQQALQQALGDVDQALIILTDRNSWEAVDSKKKKKKPAATGADAFAERNEASGRQSRDAFRRNDDRRGQDRPGRGFGRGRGGERGGAFDAPSTRGRAGRGGRGRGRRRESPSSSQPREVSLNEGAVDFGASNAATPDPEANGAADENTRDAPAYTSAPRPAARPPSSTVSDKISWASKVKASTASRPPLEPTAEPQQAPEPEVEQYDDSVPQEQWAPVAQDDAPIGMGHGDSPNAFAADYGRAPPGGAWATARQPDWSTGADAATGGGAGAGEPFEAPQPSQPAFGDDANVFQMQELDRNLPAPSQYDAQPAPAYTYQAAEPPRPAQGENQLHRLFPPQPPAEEEEPTAAPSPPFGQPYSQFGPQQDAQQFAAQQDAQFAPQEPQPPLTQAAEASPQRYAAPQQDASAPLQHLHSPAPEQLPPLQPPPAQLEQSSPQPSPAPAPQQPPPAAARGTSQHESPPQQAPQAPQAYQGGMYGDLGGQPDPHAYLGAHKQEQHGYSEHSEQRNGFEGSESGRTAEHHRGGGGGGPGGHGAADSDTGHMASNGPQFPQHLGPDMGWGGNALAGPAPADIYGMQQRVSAGGMMGPQGMQGMMPQGMPNQSQMPGQYGMAHNMQGGYPYGGQQPYSAMGYAPQPQPHYNQMAGYGMQQPSGYQFAPNPYAFPQHFGGGGPAGYAQNGGQFARQYSGDFPRGGMGGQAAGGRGGAGAGGRAAGGGAGVSAPSRGGAGKPQMKGGRSGLSNSALGFNGQGMGMDGYGGGGNGQGFLPQGVDSWGQPAQASFSKDGKAGSGGGGSGGPGGGGAFGFAAGGGYPQNDYGGMNGGYPQHGGQAGVQPGMHYGGGPGFGSQQQPVWPGQDKGYGGQGSY